MTINISVFKNLYIFFGLAMGFACTFASLVLHTAQADAKLPEVTIIIDDLGNNHRLAKDVLALDKRLTLAIIPNTPFASFVAEQARARQQELMLHLPMEARKNSHLAGPWQLKSSMDKTEFLRTLARNMSDFDGYVGVNNHMGSRLMRNEQALGWLMEALADKDLFFVDSKTIGGSKAVALGTAHGIDTASRDIFLDTINQKAFINRQFDHVIQRARSGKRVIAIGHPYPHTIEVLEKRLSELDAAGIQLVSMRQHINIVQAEQAQATTVAAMDISPASAQAKNPEILVPTASDKSNTEHFFLNQADVSALRADSGIDIDEEMLLELLATE